MKQTRLLIFTVLLERLKLDPAHREQAIKLLHKTPAELKVAAAKAEERLRSRKRQVYMMASRDPICGSGAEEHHVTWATDIADAQDRVLANCVQGGEVCTGGSDLVDLAYDIGELLSHADYTAPKEDEIGNSRI